MNELINLSELINNCQNCAGGRFGIVKWIHSYFMKGWGFFPGWME